MDAHNIKVLKVQQTFKIWSQCTVVICDYNYASL